MLVSQQILLPNPLGVGASLFALWKDAATWHTVWHSLWRIVLGFLLALVIGALCGALAGRYHPVEILLEPFAVTIRSVPVASFIVIFLIWLSAERLSVFIPMLMVLPMIYGNILEGVKTIDPALQECASVFSMPFSRRLRFIWLPHLRPFLLSSASVGIGLAWKSGIAAEILGIPAGSIGRRFYDAKIYLETTELFAWTVMVVLLCVIFEKLFLILVARFFRRLYHG